MLLDFYVENFRSIAHEQHFSMIANNAIRDLVSDTKEFGVTRISDIAKSLNVMAFYGYNSSGKSNLMMAMNRMIFMVIQSVRLNQGELLQYEPFAFGEDWDSKPTKFKVVFKNDNSIYEYGFSFNKTEIVNEELVVKVPGRSRKVCFERIGQKVTPQKSYEEEFTFEKEKLNANRLVISLAGQLGGSVSNKVLGWFMNDFSSLSGTMDETYGAVTKKILVEDVQMASVVKAFIRELDLGFEDLSAKKIDFDQIKLPSGLPAELVAKLKSQPIIELKTEHLVYDAKGEVKGKKIVPLEEYESEGTVKLVHMSGVLTKALAFGTTIAIDEFDARIHPLICQKIVDIFNDPELNTRGAQLIISTHDTNLMSNKTFRRDQISFVKQNNIKQSIVYSLMDVELPNGQAPRNDSNYEKNYLQKVYDII
jgi:AAA15 family ATPase/GTPase